MFWENAVFLAPILAILWLIVSLFIKYSGYKVKKGLAWWGAGIASLLFWASFEVFAYAFANYSWAVYLHLIGIFIGGFLAWIFALIGSVYMMYELLK